MNILIGVGRLFRLLDDLDNTPSLGFGKRSCLHEPNLVAHAAFVPVVLCVQLQGPLHDLSVQRVLDVVLDCDDNGLVHFIADNQTASSFFIS